MDFEYDPEKSEINLRERGFDFEFAALIFHGPTAEKEDDGRDYGERRVVAIGMVERIVMSAKHTGESSRRSDVPRRARADLRRVREMTEEEISATSPAELADLPEGFWDDAEVVSPQTKEAISLRVDRDVLAWFRASGPRYQSRMNAVLRSYMAAMEGRGKP